MNRRIWTSRYESPPRRLPEYDGWLDRWVEALREDGIGLVLDLGCGRGVDSEVLTGRGFCVVQTDFVERAVAFVNDRLGSRLGVAADHARGLPFRDQAFDAVVADLTLHYFEDAVTRRILADIARVLRAGGRFLSRFNSVEDRLHGADRAAPGGGAMVGGIEKHFFTPGRLDALFAGTFQVIAIEPHTTLCYGRPKEVLEVSAKSAD